MRVHVAVAVAVSLAVALVTAQAGQGTKAAHREAARKAAGQDHLGLYNRICPDPAAAPAATAPPAPARGATPAATAPRQTPPREQWYAEPVKVFDNLYFVGHARTSRLGSRRRPTASSSSTRSYDYSVEDEVVGGLKKLGLDPAQIKYVIVSHGHGDHHGGAKLLQDRFGARLVMGAPDWALVERDTRNPGAEARHRRDRRPEADPRRHDADAVPDAGSYAGTMSTLVPVKDDGRTHLAAAWGGTAFSAATPREQVQPISSTPPNASATSPPRRAPTSSLRTTPMFDETLAKVPQH